MEQWLTENAETAQIGLFFGLFVLLMIAEMAAPRRSGSLGRRHRWPVNLILTATNIGVLSFLPVTFLAFALWAQAAGVGLFNLIDLPVAVAIIMSLLGRGFISFFTHYLAHKVPLLWRIHRVHHLDTELDISTTVRFHPFEFVVNLVIGLPIVVALGLSPWVLLLYEVLDAAVTLFSHANVHLPKRLDRWLRYVIVTPDLHRVHHSSWQPETDSNFSAVFPIWDIAFGTFRTKTRHPHESMELGLKVRDGRERKVGWLLRSPLYDRLDP